MSAPTAPSVTLLREWSPPEEACPSATGCYICSTRVLCHDTARGTITSVNVNTLLSPADPFSVVFPLNAKDLHPIFEFLDYRYPLSWCGVPCGLVRLWIGLPIMGSTTPRALRLLAYLPIDPVEDVPPFIRLGAEFLHANQAGVELSSSPCEGRLMIPYA